MCEISFADVPAESTFYTYIRCLACRGIVSGFSDGTFRSNSPITRGQISKIVALAAGYTQLPPAGQKTFEDVEPSSPFYLYIEDLASRGIMSGYACGQVPQEECAPPLNRPYFRPSNNATRGQLAKIVAIAAAIDDDVSEQTYEDVPEDSPFYLFIERLSGRSVINGYSCGNPDEPCDAENRPYFRPNADVTRGQAAKIVANTFFPNCQTPAARK